MRLKLAVLLILLAFGLVACEPEEIVVEVTRVVTETVVEQIEVPVEVTRIVTQIEEVVVTATPESSSQPDIGVQPTVQPTSTKDAVISGQTINQDNAAQVVQLEILEGEGLKPYGTDLTYSPDGRQLIVAYSSDIHILDSATLTELSRFDATEFYPEIEISPDGEVLAVTYIEENGGDIELRRIGDGSILTVLEDPFHLVRDMSFSPTDNVLVAVDDAPMTGGNAAVWIWRVAESQSPTKIDIPQPDAARAVAFSPNGDMVASGTSHGLVQLWGIDGTLVQDLGTVSNGVQDLAFSPDGMSLATASRDGTIQFWSTIDGSVLSVIEEVGWDIGFITFSPDGSVLAVGDSNSIQLWRVVDGALLAALEGHTEQVEAVAFHPDGQILASVGQDGTVRLWGVAAP